MREKDRGKRKDTWDVFAVQQDNWQWGQSISSFLIASPCQIVFKRNLRSALWSSLFLFLFLSLFKSPWKAFLQLDAAETSPRGDIREASKMVEPPQLDEQQFGIEPLLDSWALCAVSRDISGKPISYFLVTCGIKVKCKWELFMIVRQLWYICPDTRWLAFPDSIVGNMNKDASFLGKSYFAHIRFTFYLISYILVMTLKIPLAVLQSHPTHIDINCLTMWWRHKSIGWVSASSHSFHVSLLHVPPPCFISSIYRGKILFFPTGQDIHASVLNIICWDR